MFMLLCTILHFLSHQVLKVQLKVQLSTHPDLRPETLKTLLDMNRPMLKIRQWLPQQPLSQHTLGILADKTH